MAIPVEGQTAVIFGWKNARESAALPTRRYTAAVRTLRKMQVFMVCDNIEGVPSVTRILSDEPGPIAALAGAPAP
jgi:hypothetical protein